MSEVTVKQFSELLGISSDQLLIQLGEAGVKASSAEHKITESEKMLLLSFLRKSHGRADESSVGEPKKITLKRKTQSELRMTGSHGRAKTVTVEVRKKKTYVKKSAIIEEENQRRADEAQVVEDKREAEEAVIKAAEAIQAEKIAEKEALVLAKEKEKEDKIKKEAEKEAEIKEKKAAEKLKSVKTAPKEVTSTPSTAKKKATETSKPDKSKTSDRKKDKPFKSDSRRSDGRRELHVSKGKGGRRRKGRKVSNAKTETSGDHAFERPVAPIVYEVSIPEVISVAELAQKMSVKAGEVIKVMMTMGTMVTINQSLDQETAMLVVEELGHTAKLYREDAIEDDIHEDEEIDAELMPRAPVVTIMGHVDHGKTSLLDKIRSTTVADGEAGGITQHIGAYHVETDKGLVTFLDTPGHEAFTAMRARGSKVTDIVVLVVAADDGVMPQTKEAVQHAQAAEVPLIVAVNKIDIPDSNPDKVKQELGTQNVIPEEWGGDTMFVNVSAKTGEGIDSLLESILLQAEMLDLKAAIDCPAKGVVIESRLDKGRGVVASILVKQGTLRKGDIILSGMEYGRIRAMNDENGLAIDEAGPSIPVEVLGLSGLPSAGVEAVVASNERKAREVAEFRQVKARESKIAKQQASQLETMMSQMGSGKVSIMNIMLKTDVHGSAEALSQSLLNLSNDEVKVKIVATSVGGINESDVNLAIASDALIIGFNVRADASAKRLIEEENVQIEYYSVIYDAIERVRGVLTGMLEPEFIENIIGLAEVRDVFRSSAMGPIAGCLVKEGTVKRSSSIRVLRDNIVVFEGELESLRRFKDNVEEVKSGVECGIGVKNYNDIKSNDQIEVFERTEVERTL